MRRRLCNGAFRVCPTSGKPSEPDGKSSARQPRTRKLPAVLRNGKKSMRAVKTIFVGLVLFLHGLNTAHAERKYTVGTQIDLGTGNTSWSTEGGVQTGQLPKDLTFFYSVYPSMTLKSAGEHSVFELSYVYGMNRTNKDLVLDSGSHVATGTFNFTLNPKWRVNFADSFEMTPD